MKFELTKKNFKELGKDLKGLVVSTASLVVDTVKIPVSAVKDVRNSYLEQKELEKKVKKSKSTTPNNDIDEAQTTVKKTTRTRKPRNVEVAV